jgi:TonB-dependent SusC/RagA subfamily outer membrane receptor
LIYVDGVRMGLEGDVDDFLSPSDIERIEVTKGAAAKALFGEEASAGVIQIFTKEGLEGGKEAAGKGTADTLKTFIVPRDTTGRSPALPGGTVVKPRYDSVRVLSPGGSAQEAGTAGSKPLVIIDGVISESGDWRNMVDATDIEKIEVIKGKAAEAVYGPRGSNGVIRITLKH